MAMVEPLPYERDAGGNLFLRKDGPALSRAVTIASGLGTTSAYTWLKMPSCDDYETVFGSTTLPCVVLGGVPSPTRPRTSRPGARPCRTPRSGGSSSAGRCSTHRTVTSGRPCMRRPTCSTRPSEQADVSIHRAFRDSPAADDELVAVTPGNAGWEWSGLRVLRLAPGRPLTLATGGSEVFVLPLRGSLTVTVSAEADPGATEAKFALNGRASVFSAVTDFAYVGRDSRIVLESDGIAEVAVPAAQCSQRRDSLRASIGRPNGHPWRRPRKPSGERLRSPRGLGPCREAGLRRLITPPGNWSSFPPHKHDASAPCEVVNEEIYYYRIAGPDQVARSRTGSGFHRTYTGSEHEEAGLAAIDETVEVRDHDVVLVPHGYHGPCIAAPGYPMYYLNVMAGPADEKAMAFCDDPAHAWLRDSWAGQPVDLRCPVTSAAGREDGLVPSYDDDTEDAR